MKNIAQGISILNRYGDFENACWMLYNNGEAAVVEMPPFNKGKERAPYDDVKSFIKKHRLFLKYAFVTHPHWDHCNTLPQFRQKFSQTYFLTHKSFIYDPYFKFALSNIEIRNRNYSNKVAQYFDGIFDGYLWQGDIGGEPVYVIHAPKHSYGDQLILFKGAMITGDWYLGDLSDCNNLVKPLDKINSINRVIDIIKSLNYHVHMLFSGHGNHLFYNADFFSVMEQCKIDHKGRQPMIRADLAVS